MIMRFAVFLSIMSAFIVLVHRYLYVRLVRDVAPAPHLRVWGKRLFILLPVAMLGGMFLRRVLPDGLARPWSIASYTWLGLLFLFVMLLLVADSVRLALHLRRRGLAVLGRRPEPVDPERRVFLSRAIAVGATVGTTGLGARGIDSALNEIVVRDVEVRIPRLPPALRGLRIAQLTDIHVGPTIDRPFVERLVARTNALQPDLIAITGDLVDGRVASIGHATAPLAQLRARLGVFFCPGNHEYYSGCDEWCAELARLGIRVLRNEHVTIGAPDAELDVIGVDDWSSRHAGGGHDLARAVKGRDPARPSLLLAHQPRAIDDAARHGIDLQISGHTHGGQIWPFGYFVYLQQPYVRGLHLHEGRTWIYVHPGTGFWGPPMRLGVPAEVAVLKLV